MLTPQTNAHRLTSSLNGLWSFRIETLADADSASWPNGFESDRQVGVPASFNEQFTDYDTFNHMGYAWYARPFKVPAALRDQQLELHFAAVNYRADVYLNGQHLGSHDSGYTPFAFAINHALRSHGGDNLLVVRVDCALSPRTVPQGGFDKAAIPGLSSPFHPSVNFDFFPYSGINRAVTLVATDAIRVESVFIDPSIEDSTGVITVRGSLSAPADSVQLSVAGTSASVAATLDDTAFTATLRIPDAKLWDVGQPNLYTLDLAVSVGSRIHDSYHQNFGVRTVEVTSDKLLLNNRPVYLQGFGKHEDFAVLGRTQPDAVNVRDLELLRWIGANSFRTSHYPYATEMLDLADRLGILVISESPAVSMIPSHAGSEALELHCQTIREQIRRDYNHPSVVMWCAANEAHSHTPEAVPYFEKIFQVARAEDSTRPHLLVMCYWPDEKCYHLCDIVGVNAYPGWYGGGDKLENITAGFRRFLDDVRQRTGKPIMITEIGADALAGLHSLPASLWTEDYQTDLLEANLNVIREKNYIIGEHLWAFSDFHTAQNHFRVHGNRKGIFTRERQPKASAHMLRKRWHN